MYLKIIIKDDKFSLNLFDRQIKSFIASETPNFYQECDAGKNNYCITPEEKILACGLCVGMNIEKNFIIGNLDLDISNDLLKFFLGKITIPDLCNKCILKTKCYTYCPITNTLANDTKKAPSIKKCKINKILIHKAEYILEKLCKKNPEIIKTKYL